MDIYKIILTGQRQIVTNILSFLRTVCVSEMNDENNLQPNFKFYVRLEILSGCRFR